MSDTEKWDRWAAERKAHRDVDHHVKLIQRAIADAEADGFVVDFEWDLHWGSVSGMSLKVVHESVNWKKAKQIHPKEK